MVGDISQPSHYYYYMCFMFIYLPVCAILTVVVLSTFMSPVILCINFFFWYYILCIFNISPQSVVNPRFTIFSANRHTKFHILCGTMWLLHIYIFFMQNTGYFGSHI